MGDRDERTGGQPGDTPHRPVEERGRILRLSAVAGTQPPAEPPTLARWRELQELAAELHGDADQLHHVVEAIAAQLAVLTPPAVRASGGRQALPRTELSPRRAEVLERVLAGATNREIAEELGISVSTVKTHVAAILGILQLRHHSDLYDERGGYSLGAS